MSVKYYRIPKDERMNEEVVCQECGRSIVNIIEIDGAPFGTTCGMKKLGLSKLSKKTMSRIIFTANSLKCNLENGKDWNVRVDASMIFEMLKMDVNFSDFSSIKEYGELALATARGE